jgi:acyl-coenzyme A synthetase/AMP-(fatty) acid ligase
MRIANIGPVFVFDRDCLTEFYRRPSEEDESPMIVRLRERGSPGLVLFSSGSTGTSKASLLDFNLLLDKFKQPRRAYRTLVFLLMDHIGGINTLFHTLCNGGTMVTIEDRRADAVCQSIQEHKIELLPTTPTFLKMLLISEAYQRYDLSSLKMITYGTEPMQASTLEHLHRVLPDIELKQTYGLSELGILQTKSRESDSLWVRVGGDGYQVKIVDNTLWIKSKSAMLGYLNAPSPFDDEGWFNTGDLVETDGEYVRILGRDSEVINVGGEKVYPAEVESVLLEMDNIVDATVVGRPSPITGQVVVANVFLRAPERRNDLIRRMRTYCKARLAPYKIPVTIEISDRPLYNDRFKKARVQ